MGKIGRFRYPDYGLDEILSSLEKIKRFVGRKDIGGEISRETVAKAWGVTTKSGAFLTKIASLSHWGLATSTRQGTIRLTDWAKNILFPVDEDERKMAISNVINNVEIWKEIYEQYGEIVTTEQLKRFLIEKGNAERPKAEKETDKILKLYIGAVPYLKSETKLIKEDIEMEREEEERRRMEVPSKAEGVIKIEAGILQQIFPYTNEGLELAKPYLSDAMISFLEAGLTGKEKEDKVGIREHLSDLLELIQLKINQIMAGEEKGYEKSIIDGWEKEISDIRKKVEKYVDIVRPEVKVGDICDTTRHKPFYVKVNPNIPENRILTVFTQEYRYNGERLTPPLVKVGIHDKEESK
jgi:hypothetical protein